MGRFRFPYVPSSCQFMSKHVIRYRYGVLKISTRYWIEWARFTCRCRQNDDRTFFCFELFDKFFQACRQFASYSRKIIEYLQFSVQIKIFPKNWWIKLGFNVIFSNKLEIHHSHEVTQHVLRCTWGSTIILFRFTRFATNFSMFSCFASCGLHCWTFCCISWIFCSSFFRNLSASCTWQNDEY